MENKDVPSANNSALVEVLQRDHLYRLKTKMDQGQKVGRTDGRTYPIL